MTVASYEVRKMTFVKNYEVKTISRSDCEDYILNIHYAQRWPSVSYAYGLFRKGELCGVVTYGTPFSSTLRRGVAGEEYEDQVLELNRLCLKDNLHNEASILVGHSLRLLKQELEAIVISYADTSQEHLGIVYQATNFLYSGLSAKRSDWKIKGLEHLHSQTISDEFRGQPNRSKLLKEKYGDRFYYLPRPRKHRYIFLCGNKRFKKQALKMLKYPLNDYPKQS